MRNTNPNQVNANELPGKRGDTQITQRDSRDAKFTPRDTRECHYCHRIGHISRFCPKRLSAASLATEMVVETRGVDDSAQASFCLTNTSTAPDSTAGDNATISSMSPSYPVCGLMPVFSGLVEGKANFASVLRDTGCSGVVIRQDLVPESCYLDRQRMCTMIDGSQLTVPLAEVEIDTPFFCWKGGSHVHEAASP